MKPMPPIQPVLPDAAARLAIQRERDRNLLVLAGAGTGKTTSIIDRVVAFLSPEGDRPPAPLDRLAVITFTRRAAGELRFRLRERLLREQARGAGEPIAAALAALDTAAITTIHSFADRLLKRSPVEAELSPAYSLVEDPAEVMAEAFNRLRVGAETGSLAADLLGPDRRRRRGNPDGAGGANGHWGPRRPQVTAELIAEAVETLRDVTAGGLQVERREAFFGPLPSLAEIAQRMIEMRDVAVPLPVVPDPQLDALAEAVEELKRLESRIVAPCRGARVVREMVRKLLPAAGTRDPAAAFAQIKYALAGPQLYMSRDFVNSDNVPWWIYQALREGKPGRGVVPHDLAKRLRGPHRWLAARIVRLSPVILAMYERVKEEHEVVDYLDLLIKLRDLLRDNTTARRAAQGLFDHIFVDEFQDTDPLQCEVLFYLCEAGAQARQWSDVALAPGRLTLVGDKKQSIYRFRRADITTYERAADLLRAQGALVCSLTTNFRSRPELVAFINDRLPLMLGGDGDGGVLAADPQIPASGGPPVHVLEYAGAGGEPLTVEGGGREIEASVIARYVRWLLASGTQVRDPATGEPRRVEPGDIAVLAPRTTQLQPLLAELDGLGIEHSIRGGTLLLSHPTVRRYLLGLRAIADRDDGVAEAALFAPPFFALDPLDLVVARVAFRGDAAGRELVSGLPAEEIADRRGRVAAARELVRDLRYERHRRHPGATARDLIERTALGANVLGEANGRQTLAALYHIAFELERRANEERLDYDGATAILRGWAEQAVFLGLPEPLGEDCVRVMTVHQAKGLEFPVVILWDGFQKLEDRFQSTWVVDRDGRAWALSLRPVEIEEPPDSKLAAQEKEQDRAERARLYYVAATRARDLLVLPVPATKGKGPYATAVLAGPKPMAAVAGEAGEPALALESAAAQHVRRFPLYRPDLVPDWACPPPDMGSDSSRREREADRADDLAAAESGAAHRATFAAQLMQAARPRSVPRAITDVARERVAESAVSPTSSELPEPPQVDAIPLLAFDLENAGEVEDADERRASKAERSRYGRAFGIAVHRTLELMLSGAIPVLDEAVEVAIAETLLALPRAEAEPLAKLRAPVATDVERALAALEESGLRQLTLVTEVDVTLPAGEELLLRGAIDLLAIGPDAAHVIDWKTDTPEAGPLSSAYPAYAEQLRLYAEAVRASGYLDGRDVRAGLLLTASGELRWLDTS